MKKWERLIIYPLTVFTVLYGYWTYNRLQTVYKINRETLIPAYEELKIIQDPNSGLAKLYLQFYSKPSPVAGAGWILQYLCETCVLLKMTTFTITDDPPDDDNILYVFGERIRVLKFQLIPPNNYSIPVMKTMKLAIKALEAAVEVRQFLLNNKKDYQTWINDPNWPEDSNFSEKYLKLRDKAWDATNDLYSEIFDLMYQI